MDKKADDTGIPPARLGKAKPEDGYTFVEYIVPTESSKPIPGARGAYSNAPHSTGSQHTA